MDSSPEPSITDAKWMPTPRVKSSITNVLWNFLNITVGIGILGLPFAMKTTGMLSTVLCLLLFGVVCTYTLNLLVITGDMVALYDYEKLAEYCFGSFGFILVSFFIFVMVFGGLVTELIAIGDASMDILAIYKNNSTTTTTTTATATAAAAAADVSMFERQAMIIGISCIFIFPFCLLRDLSSLSKLSAFKMIVLVFIVSVIIYEFYDLYLYPYIILGTNANTNANTNTNENTAVVMRNTININNNNNNNAGHTDTPVTVVWFLMISGLPKTLGIIAFSFLCHDCTFLMYKTLEKPSIQRWKTVTFYGISITIAFNVVFAVFAYLTFGSATQSNVISNYPISDPLVICVRALVILIMVLSYPPAFLIARHIVFHFCQRAMHAICHSIYSAKSIRKSKYIMIQKIHSHSQMQLLKYQTLSLPLSRPQQNHHQNKHRKHSGNRSHKNIDKYKYHGLSLPAIAGTPSCSSSATMNTFQMGDDNHCATAKDTNDGDGNQYDIINESAFNSTSNANANKNTNVGLSLNRTPNLSPNSNATPQPRRHPTVVIPITRSVQNAPLYQHLLFTFLVFFSNVVISLFVDDLGLAMALIGSVSSVNLEFVLPAMCYMKVYMELSDDYSSHEFTYLQTLGWMFKHRQRMFIPVVLVVLGVAMAIAGLLSSVNIIK